MNPFLCIGDSITAGFGYTPDDGGYRMRIQALARIPLVLTGRLINPTNVPTSMHEGYNGQRADQVIPTVLPILPILQPRNLLVCLGVNDMNQGESPAATLTELLGDCNSLLAGGDPYLQHIFVSTVPPGATLGANAVTFNSGMAAAFAGCDARIILVDPCSALSQSTDFADGLHPNAGGYAKMAAAWYTALQAVYPNL